MHNFTYGMIQFLNEASYNKDGNKFHHMTMTKEWQAMPACLGNYWHVKIINAVSLVCIIDKTPLYLLKSLHSKSENPCPSLP